jgi:hypothetical protein
VEGPLYGLQGQSVGGGGCDVFPGGGMKSRKEQDHEQQAGHFDEWCGAPTRPPGKCG